MIELRRQYEEEQEQEIGTEIERKQAMTNIRFGEPYENTRKQSKFDYGEDLVVIPVEIEIDSVLYNLIERYTITF